MNSHPLLIPYVFTTVPPPELPQVPEAYKPFPHYNLEAVQWSLLFGVCFLLGVGMGANDVADAFGTSVGTGTVTVTQAFILATVVEMMGSVASGFTGDGKALEIVDTSSYADNPDELVIGQIAMLVGCATWLIIATFYSMPVSSIHSLLGATMGFSFVLRGFNGIIWHRVAVVMAVWVFSPIASAIFTLITFFLLDVTILRADKLKYPLQKILTLQANPVKRGLFLLPGIYVIVVFANVFLFFQDGSRILRFDQIPFMYTVAVSMIIAVLAGFVALFVIAPVMEKRLKKKTEELPRIASSLSYNLPVVPTGLLRKAVYWAFPPMRNDDQKAVRLFSLLQVLTACFAGFAHGANDVTNCVAPIRDLIQMYNQGYREDNTELNISIYVGLLTTLAVLMGIWTLGIRVIRTVGENFAKMNPAT
uniref:Phosphate transporter n=1 Tax=Caenorhabditis tropicalis TaxID=1561998 RepID=A0A1I7UGS0_9PELO